MPLAGYGAFWLIYLLSSVPIWILWRTGFLVFDGPPRFELALLPAALLGAYVAYRLDQLRRALMTLALAVLFFPVAALSRENLFQAQCHANAGFIGCPPNQSLEIVATHWPLAFGAAIGLLAAAHRRGLPRNLAHFLQAAGVYAATASLTQVLVIIYHALPSGGPPKFLWLVVGTLTLQLLGALAAVVVVRRYELATAWAILLVVGLLAGWAPLFPDLVISGGDVLSMLLIAAPALAAGLVLVAALVPTPHRDQHTRHALQP